jgi:glycerate kinase
VTRTVLVAPGPFKGALPASDAARAIGAGIRLTAQGVTTHLAPIADGGEGTMDALVAAAEGIQKFATVLDPAGRPVRASFGLLPGSTAVVELAQASGYERLTAEERDPESTSTYGTGELIRAALDHEPKKIIVGVGGSATTDAGLGLARALGARLLGADGDELEGVGRDLASVRAIDTSGMDARIARTEILVACDVENPFHGPDGAAHVFGPQKGASAEAVERLNAGLASLERIFAEQCEIDLTGLPRAGAAGGAAGGMMAMLGARLEPGAELIFDAVGFDEKLAGADLCVTGEGSLDAQTLSGKGPAEAARRARAAGVPCVALCGSLDLGPGQIRDAGFAAAFTIGRAIRSLEEALEETERDLAAAGASVGGLLDALRTQR